MGAATGGDDRNGGKRLIRVLLVGLATTCLCLALQALTVNLGSRFSAWSLGRASGRRRWLDSYRHVAGLLILLMIGNVVQVLMWAGLYRLLGTLDDMEKAIYFSGVTYTSLGYGDVVLPVYLRLLGPLEAANGLVMFAITTALLIGLVQKALAAQR